MDYCNSLRSIAFFRTRLLSASPEEIPEILSEMAYESRVIEKEVTDICWYMRGSISWDQAWRLNSHQRDTIMKRIKDNIETTEKTGMPLI